MPEGAEGECGMNELEIERADRKVIEQALRDLVAFIDPKPPAPPVLRLNDRQVEEAEELFRRAHRCLWSEHPSESKESGHKTPTLESPSTISS